MILVEKITLSVLPEFVRALSMLAWHGLLIPNETSTIWNKFNAGLQDSFLEGILLGMSALVS